MKSEFKNKKIVIVGCAKGLGRSIAERLLMDGAELFLFDIAPNVYETQSEGSYKLFTVDVSKMDQFRDLLKKVLNDVGSIDGLVYVVRGRIKKDMFNVTPCDFESMIALTLKGLYFAILDCVPYLKGSKNPFVIAFSSVSAEFVGDESGPYHIAKAGVEQLVRYFAVKLGKYGIRVNAVRPGMIVQGEHDERFYSEENFLYRRMAESAQPIERVGNNKDVIESVLFLASERARFITGQILTLDGGLTIQDQFALKHNQLIR